MKTWSEEDIAESYEDELEDILCPHCEERGYQVRLGPKILMPNEPRPDDYDQFLECGSCGWICPIYQIEQEATIKDAVETQESPFESKTIIESLPKRNFHKTGKKVTRGKKRDRNRLHRDDEINEEMKRHGDRVNVVFDSNP
jgi:Fe-S-cluster-containing hydrogenase component 2